MRKEYSGNEVSRAGETLINDALVKNSPRYEAARNVLSYWRLVHEMPLSNAQRLVETQALKIDKTAYTAKRLKRYVSIVKKLKRFSSMKLKNMQDIGGCRVVLSSPKKVTQLVRALRKLPEFRSESGDLKFKDYINNPKEDGYRGYHLIGRFKDLNGVERHIEVQLRTRLQHAWATALEIVDIFTNQHLKSNQGDRKWSSFFKLISDQFALMESVHFFSVEDRKKWQEFDAKVRESEKSLNSAIDAQEFIEKLGVARKFEAFTHSLSFVETQMEQMQKSQSGFALVRVEIDDANSSGTINLQFFDEKNVEEAERSYTDAEKNSAGDGSIIVALVSTTSVNGIKEAYPNYFANARQFLLHVDLISKLNLSKPRRVSFSSLLDPLLARLLRLVSGIQKNG